MTRCEVDIGCVDPRMSMSGRPSMDAARQPLWGGGSATYHSDEPTHGRRSSAFREQDSTLFNAFEEEESVGLRPLREEFGDDVDDSDDSNSKLGRPEGMVSNKDLTRINTNINRSAGHAKSRSRDATGARF